MPRDQMQRQRFEQKYRLDEEQALAVRYNIRSIPTLMMFGKGAVVAQRAGASDAQSLRAWIEQHLN